MLVLTRKISEVIHVHVPAGSARDIEIMLVEIKGLGAVKLGVEADRNVVIARAEVCNCYRKETER